jgi:hypothetical protein
MNESRKKQSSNSKSRRKGTARVLAILVGVAIVAVSVVLINASGQDRRKPQKQQSPTTKTYVPTRDITLDQQTGQARKPTAEETQQLVASLSTMLSPSTDGLQAKTLSDGTRQVTLEGRFAPVAIARAKEDGTMEVRCVTSFEEAIDFLGLVEANSAQ